MTDLLAELRELYRGVDAALEGWSCAASTDCCRFGVTGREPYPSAIEVAELERAVAARGGIPKRRTLPLANERRCDLLDDGGKCVVYASRPLGCRTFYCDRGEGPVGERALPKEVISRASAKIAQLSAALAPANPGARPLSRVAFGTRRKR
jgi:uncharacterized protein